MLDSATFMSLVRQDLVPVNCINYNQQEDILCVHGDKRPYPTAELNVTVDDHTYLLTVLLGWDFPMLFDLLSENPPIETDLGKKGMVDVNIVCPVVTRSMVKLGNQIPPDRGSGLSEQSTPEPERIDPSELRLPDFDNSLFDGATKGSKKSRWQWRFE